LSKVNDEWMRRITAEDEDAIIYLGEVLVVRRSGERRAAYEARYVRARDIQAERWVTRCRRHPDDRDVIVTEDRIIVLHRPGETAAEYGARCDAVAPPLSEKAKEIIRTGAARWWASKSKPS